MDHSDLPMCLLPVEAVGGRHERVLMTIGQELKDVLTQSLCDIMTSRRCSMSYASAQHLLHLILEERFGEIHRRLVHQGSSQGFGAHAIPFVQTSLHHKVDSRLTVVL